MLGSGTSGDPFLVATFSDLESIGTGSYGLNKYYKQTADINAAATASPSYNSGKGWKPIDDFSGEYDGNYKYIYNLYINRPTEDNIGLFSVIDYGAILKKIRLRYCNVNGDDHVGLLVGQAMGENTTITDIIIRDSNSGGENYVGSLVGIVGPEIGTGFSDVVTITSGHTYLTNVTCTYYFCGGIVGGAVDLTMASCMFHGNIMADNGLSGGLIGACTNSSVAKSYSSGNILFGGSGGIVDVNESNITDCFSVANLGENSNAGGFASIAFNSSFSRCYYAGTMAGYNLGGFLYHQYNSTATNCFWDKDKSGVTSSVLGTAKTTAQMKTQSTFTGYNFSTPIWKIDSQSNNGYPHLRYAQLYKPLNVAESKKVTAELPRIKKTSKIIDKGYGKEINPLKRQFTVKLDSAIFSENFPIKKTLTIKELSSMLEGITPGEMEPILISELGCCIDYVDIEDRLGFAEIGMFDEDVSKILKGVCIVQGGRIICPPGLLCEKLL